MLEEAPLLSDLAISHSPRSGPKLTDCPFVDVVPDDVRLYYLPHERGGGFRFYVTEWVSGSVAPGPRYDDPECRVECLFHGVAYFDGVRHLYMGDERTGNEGYLNYPDTGELVTLFEALRDLERRLTDATSTPDHS